MADEIDLRGLLRIQETLGREIAERAGSLGALGAITVVAVERVPGAEFASCTTLQDSKFRSLEATSDVARRADRLQYELLSGPCVDAVQGEPVFETGDVSHDTRWPVFGPRVKELHGIESMLCIRLVLDPPDPTSGLNLYSRSKHAFNTESHLYATLLAAQAARAMSEQRAAHLERALTNSWTIGTAIGILMDRHKIMQDDAFELLRISSQHRNRKLHEIAEDVMRTGSLDIPGVRS